MQSDRHVEGRRADLHADAHEFAALLLVQAAEGVRPRLRNTCTGRGGDFASKCRKYTHVIMRAC